MSIVTTKIEWELKWKQINQRLEDLVSYIRINNNPDSELLSTP